MTLDGGFRPYPHSVSNVPAGGFLAVDVAACGYGYVSDAPQIDIRYSNASGGDLYVFTESTTDTTLLVRTAAGDWLCDDDGYSGNQALVVLPDASGDYSVWVGTYSEEPRAEATLRISEKDPQ